MFLPLSSCMHLGNFLNCPSSHILVYKVAMIIISRLVCNIMNIKHLTQCLPHSNTTLSAPPPPPIGDLLLHKLGLDGKGEFGQVESMGKGWLFQTKGIMNLNKARNTVHLSSLEKKYTWRSEEIGLGICKWSREVVPGFGTLRKGVGCVVITRNPHFCQCFEQYFKLNIHYLPLSSMCSCC